MWYCPFSIGSKSKRHSTPKIDHRDKKHSDRAQILVFQRGRNFDSREA